MINGNSSSIQEEAVRTDSNIITVNNVEGQTRNTIIMQTASIEEKVLPTTKLYLEKKYQDCKHTVKTEVELPVEMVNMTKEEMEENYPDWTIKEFSKDEIVLYRLANGLCNEHFVISDENGVVVVYRLDEDYNKSLYEKTDIYTEYLPSQDINRLKEGIYVYTVSDLNSELENLE
ncbi:MAG: BofC C-terminal domain-containing protein [Clostridia bacterium]|nr:BofC C-terminal domain-containing protein [Clostridia bacterium]